MKLGVLATHPIQYYAPLYRELAARRGIDLTVYFAHRPTPAEQGAGFGVPFTWNVDLLNGYTSAFLPNVSRAAATGDVVGRFTDYSTPGIADVIRDRRFDAFLVQGWQTQAYWQAMRACWATRTPLFVRGDSQLSNDARLKRMGKRWLYPHFMRRFSACLSMGERSDAYFRYYGARRVVRSPHCVDNAAFAAGAARTRGQIETVRRAWGVAPGRAVVLFAGKLVARKRPLDLVAAVRHVPEAQIVFAGEGPLRAACGREARAAGVLATFVGFQNQQAMSRVYATADVLVLPSDRRETWGLVVNEAMACGVPAVVSDAVGCAPDLVSEGKTGHVYPMGDVRALAQVLRMVMADPDRRRQMGAAAAARVAEYSVDRAATGVLEAIGA